MSEPERAQFDGPEELCLPHGRDPDAMYNSELKQFHLSVLDGILKPLYQCVRPSCGRLLLLLIASCAVCHKALTYMVFYPLFRLVFGTLYPAYASYKAVKSKNVREYVKWMMYWIVFALFTCVETITDVFLSWFPFYYEIKIILVIWLLSPATKGSSFLYRKFVHPMLSSREQEIDEYITKAKEQSYKQVLDLGSKGVNALMQTALKSGGGLVNQIKKSYSLSDLSDRHTREEGTDETDVMITDTRLIRKRQSPRRGPAASMYFSEIDVRTDAIVSVQSVEDISSGYSSGEGLTNQSLKLQAREGLVRSGSIGSSKARPTRLTRSTVVPKKSSTTDDDTEAVSEGPEVDVIYFNDRIESIDNLPVTQSPESDKSESSSDGEFLDTVESKSELEELNQTGKSNNIIEPTMETVTFYDVPENKETIQTLELKPEPEPSVGKANNEDDEGRGGKYHKKTAPEPPSAITATLVLKPGVIKPIDENVAVFCNSPKLKRKSFSKSRSPSPSRKPAKKESTMTRIMLLPQKMGVFLKHGSLVELRSSSDQSLASAKSTASLRSVPDENKKSIKQFFQRRKHE